MYQRTLYYKLFSNLKTHWKKWIERWSQKLSPFFILFYHFPFQMAMMVTTIAAMATKVLIVAWLAGLSKVVLEWWPWLLEWTPQGYEELEALLLLAQSGSGIPQPQSQISLPYQHTSHVHAEMSIGCFFLVDKSENNNFVLCDTHCDIWHPSNKLSL